MVTGQLTFQTLPTGHHTDRNLDVPSCIASTMFASDLLTARIREDMQLNEYELSIVIEVAFAIALCRSIIGKRKQVSIRS